MQFKIGKDWQDSIHPYIITSYTHTHIKEIFQRISFKKISCKQNYRIPNKFNRIHIHACVISITCLTTHNSNRCKKRLKILLFA